MKKSIFLVAGLSVMLSSCGTNKKLKDANAQIEILNNKMAECNKQSTQLKADNMQYSMEAEDCRKMKATINQREANLNSALEEQGTSMKKIKEKVVDALVMFLDAGLEVSYKNGLVYLTMPDKLAFPTGSTKISDEGRQVLSVVADVLAENKRVTAIIVGNTDSIAVTKGYIDNWSLSTERANAIVRVMRDTYKVNPAKLTSAGRGKYNPIGDNNTPDGRAMNRRVEIILNPDLSRLWELSKGQ